MRFRYVVTVDAESQAEADQVMDERLGPDEDYGFKYSLDSWEPERAGVIRPLQEKLEALMATPGEWGQIGTYPSVASAYSVATAFRLGKRPRPPGRWEFRGQQLDGGGEVRARYIGPEEKS